MKLLPLLSLALLTASAAPFRPAPHARPARAPECLTVYAVAELVTGAPAEILEGLAFVESSGRDEAIGDGGESVGRYQWRRAFQAYHERRFGAFDPRDPRESSVRAGQLLMDNLARLGSMNAAIAAHRQGVEGVRRDGIAWWYVDCVKGRWPREPFDDLPEAFRAQAIVCERMERELCR